LNAHVAVNHGVRAMGFLHACFGVGATIAPAVMTAFISAGASWRNGYLVLLAVELGLIVAFVVTRRGWSGGLTGEHLVAPARPNAILVATLALFFVYTGLEISAGQWAFTLLTEERGLSTTVSGLAVSAYWGSLTAGRFLLAALGNRVDPPALLRWSTVGACVATSLLWWDPVRAVGPIALVVLGFCLAAVFPTLVSLTPVRLGQRRASAVIGYQLAAGGLGGGALPALAGVVAGGISLAALPPFLFLVAAAMFAMNGLASQLASPVVGRPR
ncbi:MAG: MFS transporter, partial [Actinomycetota bacterium]